MSLIPLSRIKKAVKADDFDDDDEYLGFLAEAAADLVSKRTNRDVAELKEMGGGELPPAIVQAILLVVGHWYNQREAVGSVSMNEVPLGFAALVSSYRKLV